MNTEREKDIETAEWMEAEAAYARSFARHATLHDQTRLLAEAEHYERAAAALRERANKENTNETR